MSQMRSYTHACNILPLRILFKTQIQESKEQKGGVAWTTQERCAVEEKLDPGKMNSNSNIP